MTGGRNSFNVDAKRVGDRRNYLIDLARQGRFTTFGVMDDFTLAVDIKSASPSTLVWHRAFGDSEAHHHKNPEELARRYRDEGYGHFDILAYGINEPVGNWEAVARWQQRHFDEARKWGVKCIGLNLGPGSIEPHEIPQLDIYLGSAHEHDGWHIHGEHDYTGFLLPWGGGWGGRSPEDLFDGGRIQRSRWTKPEEYNTAQAYHLRRGQRLDAYNASKNRPRKLKRIVSEFGKDRMPDWDLWPQGSIYARATSRWGTSGYANIRGFNTYARFIEDQFGQPLLTVLEWEMAWAEIFYPPEYLGFNWFQWCPLAPDWDHEHGFDISRHTTLHKTMVALTNGGGTTPVEGPTMPVPDVGKPTAAQPWYEGVAAPPSAYSNLRAAPDADGRDLGDIKTGDKVRLYQGGEVNADGYWWNWVDVLTGGAAGLSGYVARVKTTWESLIVPNWSFPKISVPVPFHDQYLPGVEDSTRYNNCPEAATEMALGRYDINPGLLEIVNKLNNAGLYGHLSDIRNLLNHFGMPFASRLDPPMSGIRTGMSMWELVEELKAQRPVIVLVHRAIFNFNFGNFDGNHFVVVSEVDGNKVAILDPLRREAEFAGPEWVDIPTFLKAWETTIGSTYKYQAVLINPTWHEQRMAELGDDVPPLATIITADEVQQIADVFTGLHQAFTQQQALNSTILQLVQQGTALFTTIANRISSP